MNAVDKIRDAARTRWGGQVTVNHEDIVAAVIELDDRLRKIEEAASDDGTDIALAIRSEAIRQVEASDRLYRETAAGNAVQVKMLCEQRDVMLRLEGDVERLRAVIVNLAASHPRVPVCFERDGKICYQELSNWADYVLAGGYSRAIHPPFHPI